MFFSFVTIFRIILICDYFMYFIFYTRRKSLIYNKEHHIEFLPLCPVYAAFKHLNLNNKTQIFTETRKKRVCHKKMHMDTIK